MKRPSARALIVPVAAILGGLAVAAEVEVDWVETSDAVLRTQTMLEAQPLWRLPLGGAVVEQMQLLTPDRLLLALRADAANLPNLDLLLVDTRAGDALWRYPRQEAQATWDLLLGNEESLLYRVDAGKTTRLVALATATGRERWSAVVSPGAMAFPDPASGSVLVVETTKRRVRLSLRGVADGAQRWNLDLPGGPPDTSPARPLFIEGDVVHFCRGVERLAAADGRPRWTRTDLETTAGGPEPQLAEGALVVLAGQDQLAELDPASGASRRTVRLPGGVGYTALELHGPRVYVRGMRDGGGHVLVAVDRARATVLWGHETPAPPMSNVLEDGDRVFYATPGSVVKLDARTGHQLGSYEATNASRPYPVHLAKAGGRVVFIGELMMAGFDPETGAKAWGQGITPVSNLASLATLDRSLPRVREELAALQAGKAPKAGTAGPDFGASFARGEIARFERMAADYSRRGDELSRKGDHAGASIEHASAARALDGEITLLRMNQTLERAQALMDVQFALIDLGLALARAPVVAEAQATLDEQLFYRRALLSAYARMESSDYACRPGEVRGAFGNSFLGVTVIHLSTGTVRSAPLSAYYRGYGLWSLVDFGRGVVYHHGVGLDPTLFELTPPRQMKSGTLHRTVGAYLIAVPIQLPE